MKVLVIGSGGREHALAWKLKQSPLLTALHAAPGNGGIAALATCHTVAANDIPGLLALARGLEIGLTVVGPEQPLNDGIVDAFEAEGLAIAGPTKAAARLEGSKVFAKEIMRAAGVPTAPFDVFTGLSQARGYLRTRPDGPRVVKADGLCAGKGVFVCQTRDEALWAVEKILGGNAFGAAGERVLIEEFLPGAEFSFIVLTDGQTVIPMASCQDHKRVGDADQGPNTGGMGAYSPVPWVTPELEQQVIDAVIRPTLTELARRDIPFKGFLYAGMMMTAGGPMVLEFNTRFGDPECQPVMARMRGDLLPVLDAIARRRPVSPSAITWSPESAVCVVLASNGYPESFTAGHAIAGLDDAAALPGVTVFHAGTKVIPGTGIVTSGGRVLGVTATAADLPTARTQAYAACDAIHYANKYCRRDIAAKPSMPPMAAP